MHQKNYYLYLPGGQYLTAVRMRLNATDAEVIAHAMDTLRVCPGVYSNAVTTPGQFMEQLKQATVRR